MRYFKICVQSAHVEDIGEWDDWDDAYEYIRENEPEFLEEVGRTIASEGDLSDLRIMITEALEIIE